MNGITFPGSGQPIASGSQERILEPATFDLPSIRILTRDADDDGVERYDRSWPLPIVRLTPSELDELETDLEAAEALVKREIARMRDQIEEARTLGEAAIDDAKRELVECAEPELVVTTGVF